MKAAGECLDLLDMAEGKKKKTKINEGSESRNEDIDEDGKQEEEEEADEEIITSGATKAEDTSSKGKKKSDIERIRAKALMRRGKARMEIGSWSTLQGAEEGTTASCYRKRPFLANSETLKLIKNNQTTSSFLQCLIFQLRIRRSYRRR